MRIEVSVVLLEQKGRFLVLKRLLAAHLAGLWEFPGGKKEEGETWHECACRELVEETGLSSGGLVEVGVIVHPYADRTVEIHFFYTGEIRGLLTTGQEHAWLLPGEMITRDFPEANREIIQWLQRLPPRVGNCEEQP